MAFTPVSYQAKSLSSASATTLATVAASTTFVLRTLHIVNYSASDITVTVWIDLGSTGATDGESFLNDETVPANSSITWKGWLSIPTTSTIKAQPSASSACNIYASGANYT